MVHHALLVARGTPSTPRICESSREGTGPAAAAAAERGRLRSAETALSRIFETPAPRLFERLESTIMRSATARPENQLATARLLDISRNVVRARLLSTVTSGAPRRVRQPVSPRRVAAARLAFGLVITVRCADRRQGAR